MVTVMLTITFRPDMSADAAHSYWRTTHRDLVLAVPGVVGYKQNRRIKTIGTPGSWDGIVELTFADPEDHEAAMLSPEWAAVDADAPNFVVYDDIRTAIVSQEIHR